MTTKFMSVVSARGKPAEISFSAIWPPCRRGWAHTPHMQLDRDGAIGGRIKGPIREGIMLATGSQLARRSLGILRQQLEHHMSN